MMSSSAPVQLAILGSGAIAQTHAQAISLLPEARLIAVCSRNPSRAIELAAPANAAVFDSVEKLLASSEIDAVLIATPSGVHDYSGPMRSFDADGPSLSGQGGA